MAMEFNTVQDLINWNKTDTQPVADKVPFPAEWSRDQVAKNIVKEINDMKDPDLTLKVAKYLLGSLVVWHNRALDIKRQENADDVYIWAYDYAKLNSALEVLHDVQSSED